MLGIILGPGILGKIAPSTYSAMFSSPQSRQISKISASLKKQTNKELSHIKDTKLSLKDLKEKLATQDKKLASLHLAITQAHDRRAVHLIIALLIALVVIMLIETLLAPVKSDDKNNDNMIISPALGKVVTIRYALIAGCIAVILSRPGLLGTFTLLLTAIILALVLVLGLLPFGKN